MARHPLVVVSNRLPFRLVSDDSGRSKQVRSPGGLVSALTPALKARGGKRGIAALCIGGGEATAVAVEIA